MTTKLNGKAIIGAILTVVVFGTGAAIWEVRANHTQHTMLAKTQAQTTLDCTKERSLDRQRIARVEDAILRIDANIALVRKEIERIER